MAEPTLFGDDSPLPTAARRQPTLGGSPRLRPVQRQQVEMRCASLDQLLPPDHEARCMWTSVENLDLAPLLQSIKAVAGQPGRDANDPRVLYALWLYATFKGIGSARELDRLCQEHLAYQWLCGGMSVNYHALADFRSDNVALFDQSLNSGGDGGQMGPMLGQLQERYESLPAEMLVDGGFTTLQDIEGAHARGVTVYGPIKEEAKQLEAGKDPYQPKKNDGPGVAPWRQRMGTAAAKTIYRERAATAEWTNAQARNRGLYQVRVRGQRKVLAVALLYALVHNLLRAEALGAARQVAKPS